MASEHDKLFCRMAMKLELLSRQQALDALSEVDAKAKLGVSMRVVDLVRQRGEMSTEQCKQVIGALKQRAARKQRESSGAARAAKTKKPAPAAAELPVASPADSAGATAAPDGVAVPPPPPRGTIAPGTVMDKYTLIRKLGEGAMGVVYEAIQEGMSRRSAIKVLTQALVANQRAVQRFQREAEAAARLSHPGIVAIFGMGEYEGAHYIAMEFVDGTTIEDLIEEQSLPWKRIAEIVAAAAEAMEYAHQRGVIHRDIKPANLMITHEDDRVLVADFGLARPEGASQITGAGQLLGTPAYMAPEQASGDHGSIDRRTDVYSLGATFYEMLTVQRPFPGKAVFEVLQKVLEEEPEDPCAINSKIPRQLADICLMAMAKITDYRYQTAGDMAEDLRTYLRGGAPKASAQGGGVRRRKSKGGAPAKGGGGFLSRFTGRGKRRR